MPEFSQDLTLYLQKKINLGLRSNRLPHFVDAIKSKYVKFSSDSGETMAKFVYLYDEIGDTRTKTTEELNTILTSLQRQGAEIEDIKISTTAREVGVFRNFLIIYEADKIIEPIYNIKSENAEFHY